jgi:hypothetical protein
MVATQVLEYCGKEKLNKQIYIEKNLTKALFYKISR